MSSLGALQVRGEILLAAKTNLLQLAPLSPTDSLFIHLTSQTIHFTSIQFDPIQLDSIQSNSLDSSQFTQDEPNSRLPVRRGSLSDRLSSRAACPLPPALHTKGRRVFKENQIADRNQISSHCSQVQYSQFHFTCRKKETCSRDPM